MLKKQWPYILIVFALPLLLVFWWWGAFSAAEVETLSRPAVRYAFLISEGEYSKVDERMHEVLDLLKQQGIPPGQALTLIEDDPRSTPGSKRHARAGIMIDAGAPTLRPPLLDGILPERRVVQVKSRAHPFLAYGKAYGALLSYLKENQMTLRLPVAETTRDSTLTIEMTIQP